jgi:hypothetical protein
MSLINSNDQSIDDWAKETENHLFSQTVPQPIPEKYIFAKHKTQPPHKIPNANELENKQVSELTSNELLNILILRGDTDPNIYMLNDMGKFLMQCHQDKMYKKRNNDLPKINNAPPQFNNNFNKNFNKPKRNNYNNKKGRPIDPNKVQPL